MGYDNRNHNPVLKGFGEKESVSRVPPSPDLARVWVSRTNTRTPTSSRGGTPTLVRPRPCLVTNDTGRVQPQNRGNKRHRSPNRWWSNPEASRTNTRTPTSTRGDTPTLVRPCPCLTTTDTGRLHPQTRDKNSHRPPNRWCPIPECPKPTPGPPHRHGGALPFSADPSRV